MKSRILNILCLGGLTLGMWACGSNEGGNLNSLTTPDYTGKKYYFGFGEYLSGFMGNETKYDVKHTSDIFTKSVGGDYIGRSLSGASFGSSDIKKKWNEIKTAIKPDDMYLQYSSGHGSNTGLGVGVSYNEIRDNALAYGAKETVIFLMSCYSGNLVNSFNAKRSEWSNFTSQGKTLFVMASSRADEESATGPGTDKDEPNGPNGSAGSAYGNALWKSLIGYSDGVVDGVKDGVLTLDEIVKETIRRTKASGGHTPQVTGAYDAKLPIAKVPTKAEARSILMGTPEGEHEYVELLNDNILRD